jgi:asparagine synthetase B (glutamine-hydrolysing)
MVANKGPDNFQTHTITVSDSGATVARMAVLDFFGATLHLRGNRPIAQPYVDDAGNILCWNGEVFDGLEVSYAVTM